MRRRPSTNSLELRSVKYLDENDLKLETTAGEIRARYHSAASGFAILWVFGAGGGLGGPAGGMYERLGSCIAAEGLAASFQLDYRKPADLVSCVFDVLLGVEYLKSIGHNRVILVGHSFGGAVVISAGLRSADVIAVAVLSSQTSGAGGVGELSPKPLFVAHGEDDEILPWSCSATIFSKAGEPKTLKLYPNCRHGLDDCREELDRDLMGWLKTVLAAA